MTDISRPKGAEVKSLIHELAVSFRTQLGPRLTTGKTNADDDLHGLDGFQLLHELAVEFRKLMPKKEHFGRVSDV
jgi:hypothetical protein